MNRSNIELIQGAKYGLLVLATVLWVTACGGGTKIKSDLGVKGAPDWVNEGTQAVSDKKGRLIQGVGSAPNLGDAALQRSTADNRARAEVARVLSSYLDVALNDYMAAANSADQASVDTSIQQQVNSVSKVVLNGSRIMGRWKDKRSGDVYSFAELDVKKIKESVAAIETMNTGLKSYLLNQGETVFDNFATEK